MTNELNKNNDVNAVDEVASAQERSAQDPLKLDAHVVRITRTIPMMDIQLGDNA
jgi:hypothetical protein